MPDNNKDNTLLNNVFHKDRSGGEAPVAHPEEGRSWRCRVDLVNFVAIYLSEPFASTVVSTD